MTEIAAVTNPDVLVMLGLHDLSNPAHLHTNLQAELCCKPTILKRPPNQTGDVCANCGGMSVRTGTCTTCTECGTTGGCG